MKTTAKKKMMRMTWMELEMRLMELLREERNEGGGRRRRRNVEDTGRSELWHRRNHKTSRYVGTVHRIATYIGTNACLLDTTIVGTVHRIATYIGTNACLLDTTIVGTVHRIATYIGTNACLLDTAIVGTVHKIATYIGTMLVFLILPLLVQYIG